MTKILDQISYSIKETCNKTGFGKTKLYEFINTGKLPAKKYGRKTIILTSDLEAFLSNLEAYPASKETNNA